MSRRVLNSINRIRELAPKLNQVTDEANRVVAAVERLLNDECSIGVPCEIEARVVEHKGTGADVASMVETVYLSYARVGGKFRLAVNTVVHQAHGGDVGSDTNTKRVNAEIKPWSSCSREEKLVTFPLLPALLEKIASEAAMVAEKTASTNITVRNVLSALENKAITQDKPRGDFPPVRRNEASLSLNR